MSLLLIVVLVVLLCGGGGFAWHRSGYYGGYGLGVPGLLLLIVLAFILLPHIR